MMKKKETVQITSQPRNLIVRASDTMLAARKSRKVQVL